MRKLLSFILFLGMTAGALAQSQWITDNQTVHPLVGYNSSATAITLRAGEGALLPDPASINNTYLLDWYDTAYSQPHGDPNEEYVTVTAKSGDILTVVRGANGYTAKSHNTAGHVYAMKLYGYSIIFTPTPTFTPSITPTPGNTATNTATKTATNTATNTPTVTSTRTATNTPTATATNTATNTRTNTATNTPTVTATGTPTNTPTATPYFGYVTGTDQTPVTLVLAHTALMGLNATYSGPCTTCLGPPLVAQLGVTAFSIKAQTGTVGVWNMFWNKP